MDISEASKWFADTQLSGWNGTAWVPNIAKGNFHSSETDSIERTFLTPKENAFNAVTYPVVRTSDGLIWIVSFITNDYFIEDINKTYFLVESTGVAELYSKATTARASGSAGPVTQTLQNTTWCRLERTGSKESSEFVDSIRGLFEIALPHGTPINLDWLVKTESHFYEVEEWYDDRFCIYLRARRYDG